MAAAVSFFGYVLDLVRERRARPAAGMIDDLLAADVEGPDGVAERLSDLDATYFVALLAAAGAETVTKLVANGVVALAEHPDQWELLRSDPSLLGPAVEEVLRWRAPSQYQGRFSLAERTFHGVTIPAGHPVLIVTGAANRDPRAHRDPDRFDIRRTGPAPLAFGHGVHHCIGAHLARLEGRIAFEELHRRWPLLEVDLGAVRYVHMANVAGPSSVPVRV